jgi:hypothetical protein
MTYICLIHHALLTDSEFSPVPGLDGNGRLFSKTTTEDAVTGFFSSVNIGMKWPKLPSVIARWRRERSRIGVSRIP